MQSKHQPTFHHLLRTVFKMSTSFTKLLLGDFSMKMTTRSFLLCSTLLLISCLLPIAAAAPVPQTSLRKIVGTSSWTKGEAYGSIHPEDCVVVRYNPSIRILVAMCMLLFPIVFFVSYQYCCAGDQACECIRGKTVETLSPTALANQMKQFVGNAQGAKAHFQALAMKAQQGQQVGSAADGKLAKPNPLMAAVLDSVQDPSRKVQM